MNQNTVFTKDDAYHALEIVNEWTSNIDTKISYSLTLTGVLIGFIFNKGLPSAWKRVSEVSKLAELSGSEIGAAILVSLLYIVSFISILCFMLAIIARIKNFNNAQSIFFFGSIGKQKLVDYISKINGMSEQNIIEDLEEQIHTNSMICSKKAKCYNIGIKFLVANILLSFICMAFRLI
nr:Pycsar system effector family protein [Clostridium botulinum]